MFGKAGIQGMLSCYCLSSDVKIPGKWYSQPQGVNSVPELPPLPRGWGSREIPALDYGCCWGIPGWAGEVEIWQSPMIIIQPQALQIQHSACTKDIS